MTKEQFEEAKNIVNKINTLNDVKEFNKRYNIQIITIKDSSDSYISIPMSIYGYSEFIAHLNNRIKQLELQLKEI